jgi:hypothetical protein
MFENRAMRKILALMREEVAGDWRRLHNEELHNLYASKCLGWTGHVARAEELRNACNILVGKPEREETTWKT